jgi:methylmalonyl-CoA/ethylmalonyl-CoA epimerase
VKVQKVDHVAFAVRSIDEAAKLFIDTLGGTFLEGGDVPSRGMRTIQLQLAGTKVELLEPLEADSDVGRFLERHGPGFHHLTIYVESLDDAIADLEGRGFAVVDTQEIFPGWRETYVRPRSAFGTLIQLVETTGPPAGMFDEITLEQVLAGDVVRTAEDWWPTLRPTGARDEEAERR